MIDRLAEVCRCGCSRYEHSTSRGASVPCEAHECPQWQRRPAVIADVDGTLCDVTSVRHHVLDKPKNFDRFHAESAGCPPHQTAVDWCIDLHRRGNTILVVTGRMEKWHDVTHTWLQQHLPVPFEGPFMRADGDLRKDVEVKREIHRYLTATYDIRAAIDDNPAIIALWEEPGIPVTIVPGWDHERTT